jgi:hypothetical protein
MSLENLVLTDAEVEEAKSNLAKIQAENRIRFYDWFDTLPPFHREFINDYGFARWMVLRDQMNGSGFPFDLKLGAWRTHNPPLMKDGVIG